VTGSSCNRELRKYNFCTLSNFQRRAPEKQAQLLPLPSPPVSLQDALFSRGTSATPDLPSAGKPRLPRGLFSPAAGQQRNGSTSGGKAVARRGLLRGGDVPSPLGASALDTDDERLGSQPSGKGAGMSQCTVMDIII